ncbi:MAG TPA: hypothetical protein PKC96_07895 [Bacilli bacterium]|nr:hypothetical protein [Bacilli bacterium]
MPTIYIYEEKCRFCPEIVRNAILLNEDGETLQLGDMNERQRNIAIQYGIATKRVKKSDGQEKIVTICPRCQNVPFSLKFRDLHDLHITPNVQIDLDNQDNIIKETINKNFR